MRRTNIYIYICKSNDGQTLSLNSESHCGLRRTSDRARSNPNFRSTRTVFYFNRPSTPPSPCLREASQRKLNERRKKKAQRRWVRARNFSGRYVIHAPVCLFSSAEQLYGLECSITRVEAILRFLPPSSFFRCSRSVDTSLMCTSSMCSRSLCPLRSCGGLSRSSSESK